MASLLSEARKAASTFKSQASSRLNLVSTGSTDAAISVVHAPKASLNSYIEFWHSLESQAEANSFLASLARHLVDKGGVDKAGILGEGFTAERCGTHPHSPLL